MTMKQTVNQIQTLTPTTDDQRRNATPWTVNEIAALFELPFNDLLFRAQQVHREHFDPNAVQLFTGLKAEKLIPLQEVMEAARAAKANGATRFCMGAA